MSWQGLPNISSACLQALDEDMAGAYKFLVKSLLEKDPCLRVPVEHVAQTLRGMDQCLMGSWNNCATSLSAAATEGSGGSDSSSPIPDPEGRMDYKEALAKLEDRVHLSHCLKAFYRKYNPTKANDVLDAVIDLYEGSHSCSGHLFLPAASPRSADIDARLMQRTVTSWMLRCATGTRRI